MKVLGIDPGEKRIGLAISDPTGTISRPLSIIHHQSRQKDAHAIVEIVNAEGVELIVVGWALDMEGRVGHAAHKAERLAEAIQDFTPVPIMMWDESGTTQDAVQSRIALGVSKKKRKGHLDALAASIMLQDFLIHNQEDLELERCDDE